MSPPLVLDTHILIWSLLQPENLGKEIREHIELAQANDQLLLSSISLWEIAMLNSKKRIHIYEPIKDFLNTIVTIPGLVIKEISPQIAAESTLLPNDFHGDPADRIIVATTKVQGAILVTRDKEILNWSLSGHIKILRA